MKRDFFISTIMVLSPLIAMAEGDITGTAYNKNTGEPLDFATVQLLGADGKPLPIGTNTDESGQFILPNVKDGKYIVRISSVGSIDQERPVTVSGGSVSLGDIRLADDTKMLQEVVVEGMRSQMRFELDKKVFQVDANIAAAGQSASELLESIPSVEVDQDGEVSLRGSSSVTVWINGKESGLTADNRAQILEQIPAETIESIEVITNPSAKYSPEGTSGIINIVLKKDRRGGYFGSAELGANTRGGGNAGFSFNYNSSKWEAYASVGFRMRHNRGGSLSRRTYDDGTYLNGNGESRNHGNNVFIRLGGAYHLTEKDQFYLNGFGMFGHRWGHSLTEYTSNLPGQWSLNSDYSRTRSDNRGIHAEMGYKREWGKNHTLDIMVGYNHWGGPNHRYYCDEVSYADMPGYAENPELYPDDVEIKSQDQNILTNSSEVKVDYTRMLIDWLKLEAGFNGNYSHEDTPVETMTGTSDATLAPAPALYNTFIYNNNISALYFTLGGKIKNFSFSAGLRGEAWQIATKSLGYGESKYDIDWWRRSKFALFPSAFLSYSLPYDNELQINYTRRIRRPWGGQLNSFVDISNPTNISYGNPMLEPQYSNAFELNYIKNWTLHVISVSAYLRTSGNTMNRLSYLDNENNVLYSTWANIGNEMNAGVEIVAKNSLIRNHLDLTTTINLYNNHISAWTYDLTGLDGKSHTLNGRSRNSFAWDARVMASVKLPWGLSLQASGNYRSRTYTAQGSHNGGWSVDAGLRKNLGDWSFSLNCRDIFDSRKFRSTTDGDGYTQYDERWRGGRNLRLTIKYSFGNMKATRQSRQQNAEPMDSSGYGEEM
ncbi:MAG: TonB-dependent receptor [Muribaculaceae bacterium]|nr:TonB-dependent receptor [Muribaculaceae bacterium]